MPRRRVDDANITIIIIETLDNKFARQQSKPKPRARQSQAKAKPKPPVSVGRTRYPGSLFTCTVAVIESMPVMSGPEQTSSDTYVCTY